MKTGKLLFASLAVAALSSPAAFAADSDQTVNPGLFFTIKNACSSSVNGFAVGDELCLLQVESATFTRAIFDGDMDAGATQFGMACAGSDGNGEVIFVPSVSMAVDAVKVKVSPNATVNIPSTFCSASQDLKKKQYKVKKK